MIKNNKTTSFPPKNTETKIMPCLNRVLWVNSLFEKQLLSQDNAYYHKQYITQLECVYVKIC